MQVNLLGAVTKSKISTFELRTKFKGTITPDSCLCCVLSLLYNCFIIALLLSNGSICWKVK